MRRLSSRTPSLYTWLITQKLKALFGTWKVLRIKNSEENREEKWKEKNFGGKYKISLNLIINSIYFIQTHFICSNI